MDLAWTFHTVIVKRRLLLDVCSALLFHMASLFQQIYLNFFGVGISALREEMVKLQGKLFKL